jgi:hypothetical protein
MLPKPICPVHYLKYAPPAPEKPLDKEAEVMSSSAMILNPLHIWTCAKRKLRR